MNTRPQHLTCILVFAASTLLLPAQEPAAKPAPRKWGNAPAAEFTPHRVMLGWTGDPAHTQSITWRTDSRAATPQAQYAVASAHPDFVKSAVTVAATSGSLEIGNGASVSTYRVTLEGLRPGTRYLYRLGDGRNWGEWSAFHTAADFQFLYLGDAQNDIKWQWSRVIRTAYAHAPNAAFIVHAGDLVSAGYRDELWGEWYDAMGFIAASIPSLPVPGNHELEKPAGVPKSDALPATWRQQFSYPANGPSVPENESYYVDYQGLRLVCLNVNALVSEQGPESNRETVSKLAAWLEGVLKNNQNRWTVVVQHQGMYSMAQDRNYAGMRDTLLPLYEKYGVDLVLEGHDHLYARSRKIAGGKVVSADAPGIVYVMSVSGPKMYTVDHRFGALMAKVITNTQMFQTVDMDNDRLTLRAFSSEGEQLDGFQLEKKNGHSVYSELSSTKSTH